MSNYLKPAEQLHHYLMQTHWNGEGLFGPDPGIRINYRVGRFVKSYLRRLPWNDDMYYVQGQGYFVLANWDLFELTGDEQYREIAIQCSDQIIQHQRPDGAWEYPNPEWKGRVATTEGNWGTMGLLQSYRQTGEERFRQSALDWYEFLTTVTGFHRDGNTLAVNYFAHQGKSSKVCNNSVTTLRVLVELHEATGDERFLENCDGLRNFLQVAQKDSGEFPYRIAAEPGAGIDQIHFQCFQYNAFECLNLMRVYELGGDEQVRDMVVRLLSFLQSGQAPDGHAYYQCGNRHRAVNYHTAALAAAFGKAIDLGIEGYEDSARRGYEYVLNLQRPDGSFPYSQSEYRIIRDQRSYPRYLSMILFHLLYPETKTTGQHEERPVPEQHSLTNSV